MFSKFISNIKTSAAGEKIDHPCEAILYVIDKSDEVYSYKIENNVRLGRGQKDNNGIELNSMLAARIHAEIICAEGKYIYSDMSATNGIAINGVLNRCNDKNYEKYIELHDGDLLKLGETTKEGICMIFTFDNKPRKWKSIALVQKPEEQSEKSHFSVGKLEISFDEQDWCVDKKGNTGVVLLNRRELQETAKLSKFDVIQTDNEYIVFLQNKVLSGKIM